MYTSTLAFTNDRASPMTVTFEPVGMRYLVRPGATLRIDARADVPGKLELDDTGDWPVVYSWSGSTARVYLDDELVDDCSTPFPPIPDGMSMKDFIGLMFGGPEPPPR